MSKTCPDNICALCYHDKSESHNCTRPDCECSGAAPCSRPFSGERRFHDKHGEVKILHTWGDRACKVLVIATGKRQILFNENLHRESENKN